VRATPKGAISFVLEYRNAYGVSRRFTIGPWGEWNLDKARARAKGLRVEINKGADPVQKKKDRREDARAERFWTKVNKNGPMPSAEAVALYPEIAGQRCWIYGTTNAKRRGRVWLSRGRKRNASAVAWYLATAKWPTQHCLHKCDVGFCVRFSHLFEGTYGDNLRDAYAKGRRKGRKRGAAK
jgi:hypothetical protein